MTTLTFDELERRAYTNGDTRTAALLAAAADAQDAEGVSLAALQAREEDVDRLEARIEDLLESRDRLEDERDELKAECEKLRAAIGFA